MSTKSIISKDIRIINKQARGGIEKKTFYDDYGIKASGNFFFRVPYQKPSHDFYKLIPNSISP